MKMLALLRGINVGGNRKVPMKELCALAEELELKEVQSYIQSGNLTFEAGKMKPNDVCTALEASIEKHFGFSVEVLVRTASQWNKYSAKSQFPDASREHPHLLHLGLSKRPPHKDLAERLKEKALHGEKIKIIGDAIWVDFQGGVGKSKLTPAVFDRAAGSTVTLRNWNTVLKLREILKLDAKL